MACGAGQRPFWARCLRTLALACALVLLPPLPSLTSLVRVPGNLQQVLWLDPLTTVPLAHAEGAGQRQEKELAKGSYDEAWLRDLEARVTALLVRVYGEGHVVVQASVAEQTVSGRPPVSLAVAIDTRVLPDLPMSAEVVRAEQERLGNLVSHAAGLKAQRGDSLAISFLLFTEEQTLTLPVLAGAGAVLLVLLVVLVLARGRGGRARPQEESVAAKGAGNGRRRTGRQISDKNEGFSGAAVGNMTADLAQGRTQQAADTDSAWSDEAMLGLVRKLNRERPQVVAVVLGCLAPGLAARILSMLSAARQAETLACLALQGHVENDVLELVAREFLPSGAVSGRAGRLAPDSLFAQKADAAAWAALVLAGMNEGAETLLKDVAQISPGAADALQRAGR